MDVNVPVVNFSGVVNAPTVAVSGALSVGGAFTVQGKDLGPEHTHGGTQPGNGSTGGVN